MGVNLLAGGGASSGGGGEEQGGKRSPNLLLSNAIARSTAAGIDPGTKQGGSFLEQAKATTGGGLLTALDWLGRPGQATLRGIQAQQTGQGAGGILRGLGRGFTGSEDGFRWRSEDTTNLRGALNTDNYQEDGGRGGINPDAERAAEKDYAGKGKGGKTELVGKIATGTVDLLGSAVLDPSTFVTAGTSKAGTVAAKGASEQLVKQGAPDLAIKVSQNAGRLPIKNVLNKDEMEVLKGAIRTSDEAAIAKGGPEKFTKQAINDLNKPAGLRFAGQQVLNAETLRPAAEATRLVGSRDETGQILNRGLNNVIGDSRIVEIGGRAIKPRYDVARQFGQEAADKIGRLGRRASAEEALNTTEATTRLNQVVKASGVTDDELRKVFTPARDSGSLKKLADDFEQAGDTGRAALARELDAVPVTASIKRIKDLTAEKTIKAVAAKETAIAATKQKAIQNIGVSKIRQAIKQVDDEIESYQPRPGFAYGSYKGRLAAAQAERKELVKALGKAESEARGATKGAVSKSRQADEAAARVPEDIGIVAELTSKGRRVVRDRAGALSRELDIPVEEINKIARSGSLPKGVSREDFEAAAKKVSRSSSEMIEKNTLKASALSTQRAYADQARDNMFKGLADVTDAQGNKLLSDTPKNGFEAVNLSDGTKIYVPSEIKKEFSRVESIINNDESIRLFERVIDEWQKWWRANATVPLVGFGFHLRNAQGNIFNNFLAGVEDPKVYIQAGKLQTAIEKATRSKESFAESIRKQGLDDREVRIIEEARKRGTIGDFLVQADQEIDPLVRETSRTKRALQGANIFNRRTSVVTRSGTFVGRQIETNARLAHFIDQVNKTGSFEAADESVRKFLFDYADLTPIEQKVFRRYVPFYTYIRKNTPLQFEQLFNQPGKYSAFSRLYNEMGLASDDENQKDIPRYLLESGAIPLTGGDSPTMLSVDTPFSAALRAVDPALKVAGLIGGDKNPMRPAGGKEEAARSVINQAGGGPVEVAKFAIGQATGKDLFTGADISKESNAKTAERFAKAVSPLYGKGSATVKDMTSKEGGDKLSRVMDAVTGANATAVTDKRSEGEQYRKLEIVSKAIASAKADGVDIPSTSELQKAGIIPKPLKAKKAKVKKQKVRKVKAAKVKKVRIKKPKKPRTP